MVGMESMEDIQTLRSVMLRGSTHSNATFCKVVWGF